MKYWLFGDLNDINKKTTDGCKNQEIKNRKKKKRFFFLFVSKKNVLLSKDIFFYISICKISFIFVKKRMGVAVDSHH
jgi:hypothetical protein